MPPEYLFAFSSCNISSKVVGFSFFLWVNVKAAESNIRDVDFAAESANFSKFNILAQSGSYAMSQANSVQQNVLKLLQ